jgi:hypothetical protein
MDMFLAALGMLACMAIMALAMPVAMRLGRRLRRPTATHAPGGTPPVPPQGPDATPPQQASEEHG